MTELSPSTIAFIGGGNMASALIGGLVRAGRAPASILAIDPGDAARARLQADFGVRTQPAADAALAGAGLVVWAVKPQLFGEAAAPCAAHLAGALHLSVMAGIRSDAIARAMGLALDAARIVRSMPNTPALIGRGIAGLFATPAVSAAERAQVEGVLAPTGQTLWVDREADLDAVTALSGSGPAYVFYLIEQLTLAAKHQGFNEADAALLVNETFLGAAELLVASGKSPEALRKQVTSPNGTTERAIARMGQTDLEAMFNEATDAALARARELAAGN